MKKDSCLALFIKYLDSVGKKKETRLEWHVETIYGGLRVSVHDSDFTLQGEPKKNKQNNFVSIYTSFNDFEKVKDYLKQIKGQKFPTNSKINYHLSGGSSAFSNWNENFVRFMNDLEGILVVDKVPEKV